MEKKRLRWAAEEEAGMIGATASSGAAACVNGMAGEYPCSGIDLLSFVSLSDLNCAMNGNDIWGWTDESGNEYVIAGCADASSLVDVTDPLHPVVLGYISSETLPSSWRDMKVHKGYVYIGSEAKDHGMQVSVVVYDIPQLVCVAAQRVLIVSTNITGKCHSHHTFVSLTLFYLHSRCLTFISSVPPLPHTAPLLPAKTRTSLLAAMSTSVSSMSPPW